MQASLGIVSVWRAPHVGHVSSEMSAGTAVLVVTAARFDR
jgi:hypothetical protein